MWHTTSSHIEKKVQHQEASMKKNEEIIRLKCDRNVKKQKDNTLIGFSRNSCDLPLLQISKSRTWHHYTDTWDHIRQTHV